MKKLLLLIIIVAFGLQVFAQDKVHVTFMLYVRCGFLAVEPTRADATIYTITSDDVTYEGLVMGGGIELMVDFNLINPGIDVGYSTVFKNSYDNYDNYRTGNNEMNEFFTYGFVALSVAPNLDFKFGAGFHYAFIEWELAEVISSTTYYDEGVENGFFFGLLAGVEKNFPFETGELSVAVKINPLFSSTEYDWGFLMPMTLNLGYRFIM